MDMISTVLILLLAVVISGALARMSPIALPLPLFQIALGALIASIADLGVELQPEIFFLLFLPPLLFLDGWRVPKDGLLRDKGTILELALGLVVFTVVGLGFFIHWMIPAMPLAVAFALAAILSPTDPIAVSAIASRVPIPKRLMHILEGESLLNDASGLVCMRFAVAAALTGTFSLIEAMETFVWLASGGVLIGVGVTWSASKVKNWVVRRVGEVAGSQILISLLIPFAAYILAEHFECSGILAAVAAGISMSYVEERTQVLATTRVQRTAVWDTVQFAANGMIFVLLGEQLPNIAAGAALAVSETGHHNPAWLLVYVVAITLSLAMLRFVWVWTSFRFTTFRATRNGQEASAPGWRLVAATSLAGVRGAITLAGILTLPLTLNDGSAFPARDLAVFLAGGVIILSLVAATIGLPRLLRGLELPPTPFEDKAEDSLRAAAAQAAIHAIEQERHRMDEAAEDADLYIQVGAEIIEIYRDRIEGRSTTIEDAAVAQRAKLIDRSLRLTALQAERDEIVRIGRLHHAHHETIERLVREIDLSEARLVV